MLTFEDHPSSAACCMLLLIFSNTGVIWSKNIICEMSMEVNVSTKRDWLFCVSKWMVFDDSDNGKSGLASLFHSCPSLCSHFHKNPSMQCKGMDVMMRPDD
jgi:hypothetical protein